MVEIEHNKRFVKGELVKNRLLNPGLEAHITQNKTQCLNRYFEEESSVWWLKNAEAFAYKSAFLYQEV